MMISSNVIVIREMNWTGEKMDLEFWGPLQWPPFTHTGDHTKKHIRRVFHILYHVFLNNGSSKVKSQVTGDPFPSTCQMQCIGLCRKGNSNLSSFFLQIFSLIFKYHGFPVSVHRTVKCKLSIIAVCSL